MPDDLERCDREIAQIGAISDQYAYLVHMGVHDWQVERELILKSNTAPCVGLPCVRPGVDDDFQGVE